jgi:hypothetical protein
MSFYNSQTGLIYFITCSDNLVEIYDKQDYFIN